MAVNRPERLNGRAPGGVQPASAPRPLSDEELMHRVMDRIEQLAVAEFSGGPIHRPLLSDHGSPTRSFGVQGENAVVNFFSTTYEREGKGWWVNVNVGLGFEIRNIDSALRWTNQENLKASTGRYYVSVAHHGEWCSVMWEHNIWCGLLEGLFVSSLTTLLEDHLQGVLLVAQREANTTPYRVREYLGGRACPRGEQGMIWISMNTY